MRFFVDTTAWCAIYNRRDDNHPPAVAFWKELSHGPTLLLTSDYILDEAITLIRARTTHPQAVRLGEKLLQSQVVEIAEVTREIRNAAWDLFRKYEDKDFSFTDCTSFVIMQKLGLRKAFAFDEHFSQMGFEMCPAYNP